MHLEPGAQLGPYEIVAPLGAGGMGEVYRARDPRLAREVAVKILPAGASRDPEALKRLELEAKAAGTLNHPNIVAVFDLGSQDGTLYVVSELLEGSNLRERLKNDPPPPRKALEYGVEIARGLAAAHEKGIIHRDLKPENIFVTRDGRVKILDFGLAKVRRPKAAEDQTVTDAPLTEQGIVTGTAGYMSPEQVRAHALDHRTDIFSFGALLYELLTGKRAFSRASVVETMNAILKEDPLEPARAGQFSPPVERLVRRCLEKNPEERYQSARDLSFALEGLLSVSDTKVPSSSAGAVPPRATTRLALCLLLGAGLGLLAGVGLAHRPSEPPLLRRLTSRRGTIVSGRFAGNEVFFSAAWAAAPVESFAVRTDTLESRPLGRPAGFEIVSVGQGDSLHLLSPVGDERGRSILSRARAAGAPESLAEGVTEADVSFDGARIVALRAEGTGTRLEFPLGSTLLVSEGLLAFPALSKAGDKVAFVSAPPAAHGMRTVEVIDGRGVRTSLSPGWRDVEGVRWSPSGREVLFAVFESSGSTSLHAVSLEGKDRVWLRLPGRFSLLDAGPRGVLLRADERRAGIAGMAPGETTERDLSWWDQSEPQEISRDGGTVLFREEGASDSPAIFVRRTDGSPARFLGAGNPLALSPDGRFVLARWPGAPPHLELLPTSSGEPRALVTEGIVGFGGGWWFPDNQRILFAGNEAGRGVRLFVQDLELTTTKARAVSPEGVRLSPELKPLSPDGKWAVALGSDGVLTLYPTDGGGDPRPGPALGSGEWPLCVTADSEALFVAHGATPVLVDRLEIATGKREPWKALMPFDAVGLQGRLRVLPTPDGSAYVYGYERNLSELYLVEGLP
jgi:serine/threonine protein kinase